MFTLHIKPIVGVPSVCLLSKASSKISSLWHQRLSHLNFNNINKLVVKDLVRGFPVLKFNNDTLCVACEQGKQHKHKHPIVIDLKIIEPLELLHIDLCGPSTVETLNKMRDILVIVDDFSRFTWVYFIRLKSETAQVMIDFIKHIELSLKKKVCKIKSDNGSEFKNKILDSFLTDKGISHNFSSPYTP